MACKRPAGEGGAGATCPRPQRLEATRDNDTFSLPRGRGGAARCRTDPHCHTFKQTSHADQAPKRRNHARRRTAGQGFPARRRTCEYDNDRGREPSTRPREADVRVWPWRAEARCRPSARRPRPRTLDTRPRQPEGGEGGGRPVGEPSPRPAPAQAGKPFALRRPNRMTAAPTQQQQGREASAPRPAAARGAGKGRRRPQPPSQQAAGDAAAATPPKAERKGARHGRLRPRRTTTATPPQTTPAGQPQRATDRGRKAAAGEDAKAGGVRGEHPPRPPPRSLDDVRRYRCRIYYATAEGTRLVTLALPNLLP